MKIKITNVLILIFTAIFIYIQNMKSQEPIVLKVVTPSLIQIDINNNGVADNNESYCIQNDKLFTANLEYDNKKLADEIGIRYEDALNIGYITDEFSRKILEGQHVNIKETGNKTPNCNYANIYIHDKNYEDLLKENGFYISENNYKSTLEKAKRLKLVILNHKSLKYHTLDCEYGRAASDAVVLPLKEISKDTVPCKYCHIDNKLFSKRKKKSINTPDSGEYNDIKQVPNIFSDGDIKIILTDYTKISKPDRSCTNTICKEFVSEINKAKQSIDIAAYGFDNIPVINAALQNAIVRGVKIRLIYDVDTNNTNYYPETFDLAAKIPDSTSDNIKNKSTLTNMLMHNKFVIFDKHKVYTGSMNFSTTGFSGFNHNNIVIINSDTVADIYTNEFEQMYNGKFHTLKTKSSPNTNIIIGNSSLNIYFSPQDKQITKAIIPLIKNSKRYIYVPAFIITHNQFKNELIKAKSRGIDVKIILDASSINNIHSAANELKDSKIPVKTENYAGKLHSKTLIIDDEYIVVGSTNFSNSGENKNDENMIIIKNHKFASMYKDFFLYLWAKIPDKYLKHNAGAESKDSIGSCYDGIDNNYNGKIDKEDPSCK